MNFWEVTNSRIKKKVIRNFGGYGQKLFVGTGKIGKILQRA